MKTEGESAQVRLVGAGSLARLVAVFVVIAMAALTLVAGAALRAAPARAEPAPPYDAFYDLPAGWASTQPGAILKSRPVAVKTLQILPLNVQAWQLLYRSTGADGQPYAAVPTVMIPQGPAKPRSTDLYLSGG